MAPKRVLAVIAWLMTMTVAGNEARQQTVKLMTRPSDGAHLCATDQPSAYAEMSRMSEGTPEAVRCGMTCTNDVGCKQFNYVSTASSPCQLYYYRLVNFDVLPNCHHYYEPGQQHLFNIICSGPVQYMWRASAALSSGGNCTFRGYANSRIDDSRSRM